MARELFKIAGGTLYDPANGVDGVVRDLWIENGKIVEPPDDPQLRPARTLDASGMVVMPGGVDMHSHIAGPKVNTARRMLPDEHRDAEPVGRTSLTRGGTMGSVPSTFATGYKYAGLGYTTAFDAAIAPLSARHAHQEFADTPCIDKGFYVLLGNNHYAMKAIQDKRTEHLRAFIGWQLSSAKAYGCKLVNPGGVEVWKSQRGSNVHGLDEEVSSYHVTPRQIIRGLAAEVDALGLPHPVHIHCTNLGLPGNWTTTLATMEALEGHRGHLTHIQFHSYAGGDEDEDTFGSKTSELAEYVNSHPNLTVDVGQVMFGRTTSMTGDSAVGHYLHKLTGNKWYSSDTELEAGCGIVPMEYKNKSLIHAIQWAIGLEWYLLVNDPWQVAMSTDHPNGGSFLAYPQIVRLLMDRTYRADVLKTLPARVRERTQLADLDREYTLGEIAIITRAGPARMLGLTHKGHLGVGADADVTIYTPNDNREEMFSLPRHVIKAGQVLVEQGEIRLEHIGKTLHVAPSFDPGIETDIANWFEQHYSIQFGNYPIDLSLLAEHQDVPCR